MSGLDLVHNLQVFPYGVPTFDFLGDNTSTASAAVQLARIKLTAVPEASSLILAGAGIAVAAHLTQTFLKLDPVAEVVFMPFRFKLRRRFQFAINADPHYWYAPIMEDPNERGHDAIRRIFLREMIRALAPQS